MRIKVRAWACLLLAVTTQTFAGEIIFKNGDRLTGEVTELGGGKLKVKSAVAGEITVKIEDVATFSTDAPVDIKLKSGTVLRDRIEKAPETGVVLAGPSTRPATPATSQPLTLNEFDTINEPKPIVKWTGNIKAGAIVSRGNTDTEAVNVGFEAARRYKDDRITSDGQYLFGRQRDKDTGDDNTTTDNWRLQGKYDHFLTKKLYEYVVGKVEHDRIAELDLRLQSGVGLGYQWIESAKENLLTEAGVGYTYEDYATKGSEHYANLRGAAHYDRVLRENVKFISNLEYLPSLENLEKYNLNADAGIRVAITSEFFADLKVEWKFNSQPAPGAEENDFRYILSLGYAF